MLGGQGYIFLELAVESPRFSLHLLRDQNWCRLQRGRQAAFIGLVHSELLWRSMDFKSLYKTHCFLPWDCSKDFHLRGFHREVTPELFWTAARNSGKRMGATTHTCLPKSEWQKELFRCCVIAWLLTNLGRVRGAGASEWFKNYPQHISTDIIKGISQIVKGYMEIAVQLPNIFLVDALQKSILTFKCLQLLLGDG